MSKLNNVKNPVISASYHNVTSNFGYRKFTYKGKLYKGQHNGIDLTPSSSIIAINGGKVTAIRNSIKGYSEKYTSGNYITLYHGSGYYTVYYHLKKDTLKVKVGDYVKRGQKIAVMGSTGFSTGTHLHFGVKLNGKWTDPKPYLLGIKNVPNYVRNVIPSVARNIYSNQLEVKITMNIRKGAGTNYESLGTVSNGIYNWYETKDNGGYIWYRIADNQWIAQNNKNSYLTIYKAQEKPTPVPTPTPTIDLLLLVKKTIRGDFGNGATRRKKLGNNYAEVQKQVNLNLKKGLTHWDNIKLF